MALATVMGLVAIVVSIAASQRLVLRMEAQRLAHTRAKMAAEAGIQRAVAALTDLISNQQNSSSTRTSSSNGYASTLQDDWATLGTNGQDKFIVGNSSFKLQIIDTNSLININVATEEQLLKMPLTQEQIDSLLDWRTTNTDARANGAKDQYYNTLTNAYNAKLADFESVDELLLVRGFTAPDIYDIPQNQSSTNPLPNLADGRQPTLYDIITADSYSPQTDQTGATKINANTATVQTLIQAGFDAATASAIIQGKGNGTYSSLGDVFGRASGLSQAQYGTVLDKLTVSSTTSLRGKLNLNTASEAALSTLPNLTSDLAQAIVQRQSTGFAALSELLEIPGFNNQQTLQNVADYFCVSSQYFIVRVIGEAGGTQVALEATIDLRSGKPRVVTMTEPPFSDMATRWGWTTNTSSTSQTGTDITLKEAQ